MLMPYASQTTDIVWKPSELRFLENPKIKKKRQKPLYMGKIDCVFVRQLESPQWGNTGEQNGTFCTEIWKYVLQ